MRVSGVYVTKSADHVMHMEYSFNKVAGTSFLVIRFNSLLLMAAYFNYVS